MTSFENDLPTKSFFESKNYFGYNKDLIKFFVQDKLPLIDITGNLMLSEIFLVKEVSNGNGDVFFSMKKNGIIDDLISKGIEWIFIGGIDNVLLKPVDPLFLGATIHYGFKCASKSIFKTSPDDKINVFCKKNNKPYLLDYDYITNDVSNAVDDFGNYLYRDINIVSHLFHIDSIKECSSFSLPYHRAFKKNTFVNYEGVKEVPQFPNSYKFEKFIFDAFFQLKDMFLLRVDENDEFAPIKDFTSIYNPETAKEKYLNFHKIENKNKI